MHRIVIISICLIACPVTAVGIGCLCFGLSSHVDFVRVGEHAFDNHCRGLDMAFKEAFSLTNRGICAVLPGREDGVDEDWII